LPYFIENPVEQHKDVDVILLRARRMGEQTDKRRDYRLDDMDGGSDDKTADRGAADNHQLDGLINNGHIAVLQQVTTEYASSDYDNANYRKHELFMGYFRFSRRISLSLSKTNRMISSRTKSSIAIK